MLFFPLFGFDDDKHICTKWVIQAENAEEALSKAKLFFEYLPVPQRAFLYPSDKWVGPLVAVKAIQFDNGIAII